MLENTSHDLGVARKLAVKIFGPDEDCEGIFERLGRGTARLARERGVQPRGFARAQERPRIPLLRRKLNFALDKDVESITNIIFSEENLPRGKIQFLRDRGQTVKFLDAGFREDVQAANELSFLESSQTCLG